MRNERPIIFSGPMVQAILAGKKTETRRIVKLSRGAPIDLDNEDVAEDALDRCPYGRPGGELWVREAFRFTTGSEDFPLQTVRYRCSEDERDRGRRWKPSIHMPRWASRIQLSIKNVFVMRVQTLCVASVCAEGIEIPDIDEASSDYPWLLEEKQRTAAIAAFRELWDGMNAKRGYPFRDNPLVYAIKFRRVT